MNKKRSKFLTEVDDHLKVENTFHIPSGDTPTLNGGLDEEGALFYKTGEGVKYYDGVAWNSMGGGGATDTNAQMFTDSTPTQITNATNITESAEIRRSGKLVVGSTTVTMTDTNAKLKVVGNIELDASTATAGNITKGGIRFLHNYGTFNTALGLYSGKLTTTGGFNTSIGAYNLNNNTTGHDNTSIGCYSLGGNLTGYSNVSIGVYSLYNNLSGITNVSIGNNSLYNNSSGYANLSIGDGASYYNTIGNSNIALGYAALNQNILGINNIAIGTDALYNNSASNNLGIGYSALGFRSVSISAGSFVIGNTYKITSIGTTNFTLIGASSNTVDITFVATGIGTGSGYALLTISGQYNTAIGNNSLQKLTTGTKNTALGYNASNVITDFTNTTTLGYNVQPTASNQVVIGDDNVTETKLKGNLILNSTISKGAYTYTLPSASGTLALEGGSLKITYTGIPISTLSFSFVSEVKISSKAISGQVTYQAVNGIKSFVYTEYNSLSGYRLTSISFDDLEVITSNIEVSNSNILTSISFPSLISIYDSFGAYSMPLLTSISLPVLTDVYNGIGLNSLDALTTFSLPSMANLGNSFYIDYLSSLTTVSLPSMINYDDYIYIYSVPTLSSITIGTIGTLKSIGGDITMQLLALPSANVNSILALLVSLDGTNGTTLWANALLIDGGTNGAPTGAGITDKATLIARGATVTTN